jgi:hypothetical protein
MNMEMSFRNLDRTIEAQPMPEQFRDTKALVYCNDCSAKSSVKYHWLGLKCAVCDSYNTAQLRILSDTPISSSPAEELGSPQNEVDTIMPEALQAANRGRTLTISNQAPRNATSASALDHLRPAQPTALLGRTTRAASEDVVAHTQNDLGQSEPMDTDDTDGEDSVEFWGGESPRPQASHPGADAVHDDESSGSYGSDDSDVTMDDDDDEDDSADEKDNLDLDDLIGHR